MLAVFALLAWSISYVATKPDWDDSDSYVGQPLPNQPNESHSLLGDATTRHPIVVVQDGLTGEPLRETRLSISDGEQTREARTNQVGELLLQSKSDTIVVTTPDESYASATFESPFSRFSLLPTCRVRVDYSGLAKYSATIVLLPPRSDKKLWRPEDFGSDKTEKLDASVRENVLSAYSKFERPYAETVHGSGSVSWTVPQGSYRILSISKACPDMDPIHEHLQYRLEGDRLVSPKLRDLYFPVSGAQEGSRGSTILFRVDLKSRRGVRGVVRCDCVWDSIEVILYNRGNTGPPANVSRSICVGKRSFSGPPASFCFDDVVAGDHELIVVAASPGRLSTAATRFTLCDADYDLGDVSSAGIIGNLSFYFA